MKNLIKKNFLAALIFSLAAFNGNAQTLFSYGDKQVTISEIWTFIKTGKSIKWNPSD